MISSYFKFFLPLFLLPLFSAYSQSQLLWEPEIEISTKLSDRWALNAGIGYRNRLTADIGNAPLTMESRFVQGEMNASYEVGFYSKLGGGVMYRVNKLASAEEGNELRFTEQFSFGKTYNALQLVHRIKADQRLENDVMEHRLRYRVSADFPLGGLRLDTKEFYGVLSTESLFNVGQDIKPMWDQRFTVGLGNQISDAVKLQIDFQYRLEDYANTTEQRFFIVTGMFYKF